MKTPYDATLRLRRRELDDLARAIGEHEAAKGAAEAAQAQLLTALGEEARLVASDFCLASPGWRARMKGEHGQLVQQAAKAGIALEDLRGLVRETYGEIRGIEAAAEAWRRQARLRKAAAEQLALDDMSAANQARRQRAGR